MKPWWCLVDASFCYAKSFKNSLHKIKAPQHKIDGTFIWDKSIIPLSPEIGKMEYNKEERKEGTVMFIERDQVEAVTHDLTMLLLSRDQDLDKYNITDKYADIYDMVYSYVFEKAYDINVGTEE